MDTLLNEITNLKLIKNDLTSLVRYAARILSFVNNMEQNGRSVTSTSEAPLDTSDNIEFGREMLRMGKEENVLNLIDCLNKEASLQSHIKRKRNNVRDTITFKKTEIAAEEKPVTKRNCHAYLAQL